MCVCDMMCMCMCVGCADWYCFVGNVFEVVVFTASLSKVSYCVVFVVVVVVVAAAVVVVIIAC